LDFDRLGSKNKLDSNSKLDNENKLESNSKLDNENKLEGNGKLDNENKLESKNKLELVINSIKDKLHYETYIQLLLRDIIQAIINSKNFDYEKTLLYEFYKRICQQEDLKELKEMFAEALCVDEDLIDFELNFECFLKNLLIGMSKAKDSFFLRAGHALEIFENKFGRLEEK